MIIVLIHWRIKPTDESVSRFCEWWKNEATVKDEYKPNLVGEFLSDPLPAEGFQFLVDDLRPRSEDIPHKAFVNVGIWKDWQSFYEAVGHNFRDDKPLLDFEADKRSRTILSPKEWRIGGWHLPEESTCK